ncbi:MAG: thiamine diphosphokinase [Syntrophomonadaceae bacterium]|jgi:thiamine pyrophosphokinase|nr:thiamine diphosphokinase [Syntrophomonadaceae bacterium]
MKHYFKARNDINVGGWNLRFLLMANGEYGELSWYRPFKDGFDRIICIDGGTDQAMAMGMTPWWVVGDMDSISEEATAYAASRGAAFTVVPREKDNTDFQLALELAEKDGATSIIVWGGIGTRLDHSLSNLFSATRLVLQGIEVCFRSPREDVYLVSRHLVVPGKVGDTVSLITLGDEAGGITLRGFQYPLADAVLDGRWQCAVSNVIVEPYPEVEVGSGVVAVIHYQGELP